MDFADRCVDSEQIQCKLQVHKVKVVYGKGGRASRRNFDDGAGKAVSLLGAYVTVSESKAESAVAGTTSCSTKTDLEPEIWWYPFCTMHLSLVQINQ